MSSMANPFAAMFEGRTNDEVIELLNTSPFDPEFRLQLAVCWLKGPGDVIEICRPIARQCPRGGAVRNFFDKFAKMTMAEIEDEMRETNTMDGVTFMEALSHLSPEMRRRHYIGGFLVQAKKVEEEDGPLMFDPDMADSDEYSGEYSDECPDEYDNDQYNDDSDESSDGGAPGVSAPRTEADRAYEALQARLDKEHGLKLLMFEGAYAPGTPGTGVTLESLLKKEHLLLPEPVASAAQRINRAGMSMHGGWMGGGTSLSNSIWFRLLMPAEKRAADAASRGEYQEALGQLLGILIYGACTQSWLTDNEVYCQWDEFGGFFSGISDTWRTVLAQPDEDLGVAHEAGVRGGYRPQRARPPPHPSTSGPCARAQLSALAARSDEDAAQVGEGDQRGAREGLRHGRRAAAR